MGYSTTTYFKHKDGARPMYPESVRPLPSSQLGFEVLPNIPRIVFTQRSITRGGRTETERGQRDLEEIMIYHILTIPNDSWGSAIPCYTIIIFTNSALQSCSTCGHSLQKPQSYSTSPMPEAYLMADRTSLSASAVLKADSVADPEKITSLQVPIALANPPKPDDEYVVEFDGDDDKTNRMNWPRSRRWTLVSLIATLTLATYEPFGSFVALPPFFLHWIVIL